MKYLDQITAESVVSIDIETVRIAEKFEDLSESFQSAWEYKHKQDGVVPSFEELAIKWEKNSALYAEFSKICAVSIAFLNTKGKLSCMEFYGIDEVEILTKLSAILDRIYLKDKNMKLLAHAGKFFDYPFLSKRFVINKMDVPLMLDVLHLKPWEAIGLLDSNDIWRMGGTGAGSSLQALCTCLGVEVSKTDMVGDEVGKFYYQGELKRIGRYCSQDAIACFNILRALKKDATFPFTDVIYIEENQKVQDEIPILNKLIIFGKISPEEHKKLKKDVKPFLKTKEWQILLETITSVNPNFKL